MAKQIRKESHAISPEIERKARRLKAHEVVLLEVLKEGKVGYTCDFDAGWFVGLSWDTWRRLEESGFKEETGSKWAVDQHENAHSALHGLVHAGLASLGNVRSGYYASGEFAITKEGIEVLNARHAIQADIAAIRRDQ